MNNRIKAVCLAAGLGTRLQPLTTKWPKAAIPVCGIPSLYYALYRIAESGLNEVAINSHHHEEQVRALIDSQPFALDIHLSHEPTLLGSGGVYPTLSSWRKGCDLLVYNPDIIGALDFEAFYGRHYEAKACVSIAVLENPLEPERASVHCDSSGRVIGLGKADLGDTYKSYCGYGAFLLSDQFLQRLPSSGSYSLGPHIEAAIESGLIVIPYTYDGYWCDIGNSLEALRQVHLELIEDSDLTHKLGLEALWQKFQIERLQSENASIVFGSGMRPDPSLCRGSVGVFASLSPETRSLVNSVVYSQTSQESLNNSLVIGEYTV